MTEPNEVSVITIEVPTGPQSITVTDNKADKVLSLQVPGMQGPPGAFKFGAITTGEPDTEAFGTVTQEDLIQTLNLTIPRGSKGDSNTLTIGTVIDGVNAGAIITGDAPHQVLNLVIPRGLKGDKGDRGDRGIQGIQGLRGLTGAAGNNGAKGDKGDTGPQGVPGIPGADGAKGEKGDQGPVGETGLKGDKGDRGLVGATGAPGSSGTNGVGIPAGGVAGTVLQKDSDTSYDTSWLIATPVVGGNTIVKRSPTGTFSASAGVLDEEVTNVSQLNAAVIRAQRRIMNAQQVTTYGLTLPDAGNYLSINSATPATVGIPLDADVPFPSGTVIDVVQTGAGRVTIIPAPGMSFTSITGTYSTASQWSRITLYKTGANIWRVFGDLLTPNWINVTPASGWTNFGSTFSPARYKKHANGIVELDGLISVTAAPLNLFTLPANYWPTNQRIFNCRSQFGSTRVDVLPTGIVTMTSEGATNPQWLSLNNIMFTTDQ